MSVDMVTEKQQKTKQDNSLFYSVLFTHYMYLL